MVERISLRFNSLNNILLQDLDVRAESYSDACSAGIELVLARSQRDSAIHFVTRSNSSIMLSSFFSPGPLLPIFTLPFSL